MKFEPRDVSVSLDDALSVIVSDVPLTGLRVTGITHDNRAVKPGFVFVGVPGFSVHGAKFAASAVEAGAVAILTDGEGAQTCRELNVPVIVSADPRSDMAILAREIYADAQSHLLSVGITGTNGKTTTAHMIAAVLREHGFNPMLLGTVGIRFEDVYLPSSRTTPEATDLHAMLLAAQQASAKSFVMEVSSHALSLGRVDGVDFNVAVFTGLSQDHLDFHHTMDDYFEAKAQLFTESHAEHAVICLDDEWGVKLSGLCDLPTLTYSTTRKADWTAENIETANDGRVTFVAHGPAKKVAVEIPLPGRFNVANALAAIATADLLALSEATAAASLTHVTVPGRLERIECGQSFVVLVDYAHTPDAVAKAVAVARECATGKVISVLGCGGDRDSAKREPMGEEAGKLADVVIVTDDNPRSEDPTAIRASVLNGVARTSAKALEIAQRDAAILEAITLARAGDCIIILGKGHESGQEVAGVITPFDDREVAVAALKRVAS
jgi:UDP-N-acetylmuramoyl-L-alanyl-D-glutamate--2,6-diaminopimelate ligase